MGFRRNLLLRVIVGVVGIPAIVFVSLKGGIWLITFVSILALLGSLELNKILSLPNRFYFKLVLSFASIGIILLLYFGQSNWALAISFVVVIFAAIVGSVSGEAEVLGNVVIKSVFSIFYCGYLFAALPMISTFLPDGGKWVVSMFIIIWSSDTAAYFGGVLTGKKKLALNISPGKTVAGLYWGFFGAALAGVVLALTLMNGNGPLFIFLVSIILSGIGTVGDLFESSLKRIANIKDSSSLIPGHGGVLDRFDSVLFAAPTLLILLELRYLLIYTKL